MNDRGMYTIEFANDLAAPLALQDDSSAITIPLQDLPARLSTTQVGTYYLANLTQAQITQVTSTTVSIDAGATPSAGGIEVRTHDYGWGPSNDRNLLGRFSGRLFSLPRLGRTLAEVPIDEKDRISHRGRAAGRIRPILRQLVETGAA